MKDRWWLVAMAKTVEYEKKHKKTVTMVKRKSVSAVYDR